MCWAGIKAFRGENKSFGLSFVGLVIKFSNKIDGQWFIVL